MDNEGVKSVPTTRRGGYIGLEIEASCSSIERTRGRPFSLSMLHVQRVGIRALWML